MRPRIAILSAVSGGPIDRLADHLQASGRVDVSVCSALTTISWRRWRGKGGMRSLMVRLLVLLAFPWYSLLTIREADVVVTTTNPFWMPNLVLITRRIHRRPVITLVYDVYPDSLGDPARLPAALARLLHTMNRSWMRRSDAVVFISEGMLAELTCRYGEPRRHRVIVTGTDVSEFEAPEPQLDLDAWASGRTMISYVGNAGHVHDIDTVSAVLRGTVRELPSDVAIFISASGVRAPVLQRALQGLPHVRFEGPLRDDRWAWVQARTDVAVVSLNADSAFSSMPSKYFSALGAGCAVCVIAPRTSDLYRLTERYAVGIAIEPGATTRGIDALSSLIRSPARLVASQSHAKQVAKERFDLGVISSLWINLVDEVIR